MKRDIHVSVGDEAVIYKHQFQAEDKFRFLVMDIDELPQNLLKFPDVIFALDKSLLSYIQFIDNQLPITTHSDVEISIFSRLLSNLRIYRGKSALMPDLNLSFILSMKISSTNIVLNIALNQWQALPVLAPVILKHCLSNNFKKHPCNTSPN